MMNDESLKALLKAADHAAGAAVEPQPDLAARVRRRRDRRRGRKAAIKLLAAGGACYLLGLLTMWPWTVFGSAGAISQAQFAPNATLPPAAVSSSQVETAALSEAPRAGPDLTVSAVLSESPYQRLRQLGDEYLLRRRQFQAAVEFYRRALDAASDEELAVSDDEDSWLLISLKRDRLAASAHRQAISLEGDT